MAQDKLNKLLNDVPKECGDELASLFGQDEVVAAINSARGTVYTDMLRDLKDAKVLMDLYPEFNGMDSFAVASNVITKSAAVRRAEKILYPAISPTVIIEAVPVGQSLDVMLSTTYSMFKGTATHPVFSETSGSLLIFGITISSANAIVQFLKQPIDVSVGALNADLIEPWIWLDLITVEAVKNLKRKKQSE